MAISVVLVSMIRLGLRAASLEFGRKFPLDELRFKTFLLPFVITKEDLADGLLRIESAQEEHQKADFYVTFVNGGESPDSVVAVVKSGEGKVYKGQASVFFPLSKLWKRCLVLGENFGDDGEEELLWKAYQSALGKALVHFVNIGERPV